MTFARPNRLTTHSSERIPVVKRRMSLLISPVPLLFLTLRWSSSYSVCCCTHHSAETIYKTKGITAEKYSMPITKYFNKLRRTSVVLWRNCATSRKVAGSIPDCVSEISDLHIPSGRTMALGLTEPLTEMSTSNIPYGGKGSRCVGLTTLPPSRAGCLEIYEPQPPATLRACPYP